MEVNIRLEGSFAEVFSVAEIADAAHWTLVLAPEGPSAPRCVSITSRSSQASPQLDVDRFAEHGDQFVGEGIHDDVFADVRLGPLGATPVHRVAVVAPIAPLPSPHRGDLGAVGNGLPVDLDRQLPAHRWLPDRRGFPGTHCGEMQRTPFAAVEPGAVQEDARAVDHLGVGARTVAEHVVCVDRLVVLEQICGTLRVGVRVRPGQASFAEFDAPRLPAEAGVLPPVDKIAAVFSLIPSEIGFENHRPACFAAGNAFAFIPVATLDAMARARVENGAWATILRDQGLVGAYLYTRQCEQQASSFHARMFAPDFGIPEDPATGSAVVCLAGAIHHFDRLPDGDYKKIIEQGFEMLRPSLITLSMTVTSGKLSSVRIGGHSVRVAHGTLQV